MNATDRIKRFSIINKVNKGNFDDITNEEYLWLKNNPDVLKEMNQARKKREILNSSQGAQGTIEEILFVLDLSDRMYR